MPTQNIIPKSIAQVFSSAPETETRGTMHLPAIEYLRVCDFDRFLHYKDRHLVWIKSYTAVLDEYVMRQIPDAKKWHMHAIILMAARTGNRIPNDPFYVQQYIKATEPVDLLELVDWGLLEVVKEDSNPASEMDSSFATKFVPTRKQKRGKSASESEANLGKNLPQDASTSRAEQSRVQQSRVEQSRAESIAAAAAIPERAAAPAAAKKKIKEETHASPYDFETILAYVNATKQGIHNPPGLARTLYRSGEEDVLIAGWLAEQEAETTKQQEAEERQRQEAIVYAQESASSLIQQGSVRDHLDCSALALALGHFQAVKEESDFNLITYRQLKRMVPYALAKLTADPVVVVAYAEVVEWLQQFGESPLEEAEKPPRGAS